MKRTLLLSCLLVLVLPSVLQAKIKLPALVGDHMVLQQQARVNFWGWATPGAQVILTPSWSHTPLFTTADGAGKWLLKAETPSAGGPYTITISDGEEVALSDILIGEVWICSGQSNMEMHLYGLKGQTILNSTATILEAASYPQIRLFKVPRSFMETPLEDVESSWLVANPSTVGYFSAVAYFYGRNLHRVLGVPVGLITSAYGGTAIETWMSEASIDATVGIDHLVAKRATNDFTKIATTYNGMLYPLINYTAKGFIWYQGESNIINYRDYDRLMISMVDLWRRNWGDTHQQMPFYCVELAPYSYGNAAKIGLPLTIEAQYRAIAQIPNSGISASADVGHPICIHPADKQTVGMRLALLALDQTYGVEGLPAHAPTFKAVEYRDGAAFVSFNNVPRHGEYGESSSFDLYYAPSELVGFEIAGEDQHFYPAQASHVGREQIIEVRASQVPNPVAVRYAFRNYHQANVCTNAGLPLVPFRTDIWDDAW